jgi:hypothetical protein
MTHIPHLARSRIAKAMTDIAGSETDFEQAATTLDAVLVAVSISPEHAATPGGQAAVLTIVATSCKCFGNAVLVCIDDVGLHRQLGWGTTLFEAVRSLGGKVSATSPEESTHIVSVGAANADGDFVRCWWSGWNAGILPAWDDEPLGSSSNPLSGIFAGALAVREIFANAIRRRRSVSNPAKVSLWEPQSSVDEPPSILVMPTSLWLVGLGHLGQGFLWSLAFLPVTAHAILQDDQTVGEENVATGLVTRMADFERKNKKARVAARCLEGAGWTTAILERRNYGDLRLTADDPAVVLSSIDEPSARIDIAKAGHPYLLDAGVGHGPVDFEIGQVRVVPRGLDPELLWSRPATAKDVAAVLKGVAYQHHAQKHDACGTFNLAEASVAVPFVGAAIGALAIAQLLRLAAMRPTTQITQIELGMPQAASVGASNPATPSAIGGTEFSFE